MSKEEILKAISKALPTILPPSTTTPTPRPPAQPDGPCDEEEEEEDGYLIHPVGTILKQYTTSRRQKGDGGKEANEKDVEDSSAAASASVEDPTTFVITVADGPSVGDYHSQIQKLALWFIENADEVDVSNSNNHHHHSGFWKVLYLFQQHNTNKKNTTNNKCYSLAGYLTLFHFHAPFHKPTPGMIARICQALVLPPYQGQGHGRQLMQCVYDLSHGGVYDDIYPPHEQRIVQVNVEDPSPGFVALRNAMDFQWLTRYDHVEWWPEPARDSVRMMTASTTTTTTTTTLEDGGTTRLSRPEALVVALSETAAIQVADQAKILPRQVHIVYEWMVFRTLRRMEAAALDNSNNDKTKKEEWETRFRLLVKSRLNREHREDMAD